jgi:hypothetical protein
VVILTEEFCRSADCMAQLHALLLQCRPAAGSAPDDARPQQDQQAGPRLLVVLHGLSMQRLRDPDALYGSGAAGWPLGASRPGAEAVEEWAGDLRAAVSGRDVIQEEQVRCGWLGWLE